jgi:hypothetical protein
MIYLAVNFNRAFHISRLSDTSATPTLQVPVQAILSLPITGHYKI